MNEFEFSQETSQSFETNENMEVNDDALNQTRASINPAVVAYGAMRVAEIPEVREKIEEGKEAIGDVLTEVKDTVVEFGEKVTDGISDFCMGVYENVKDFFSDSKEAEDREFAKLNEGFTETREFGIQECTDAALSIFTPEVIANWSSMSRDERIEIANAYAGEVAKAFELVDYKGVIIETMEPGIGGSNNGDGYIHLTNLLVEAWTTPFEIMDTITHEMRHQYQDECVRGYHDIPDDVRTEWIVASSIYNYDYPSCYDPWGYKYNPLEIDSRYAGESVVRNVSNQMFNELSA